eukprot:CAMPEP_0113309526 /NCGR_PEP_ID=MMETSP0010_2-20120614/7532_1 /TAXON_ID=216773 ORGANISM="Corethron hystrix, Strain 308" /NCGR_SAMPLE_ID=MMETSP0010_2 /ASSEMBLY_ACC=CAM_ASM_000155 /LENGTH=611 /DNA_ID=CAMNT_0000164791 /DNA_START=64 /DNA_END=1899 /DNA_ORIENTATION=- /assembly_acc=CAM_ASM_000155
MMNIIKEHDVTAFSKEPQYYGVHRGKAVQKCVFFFWEDCESEVKDCDEAIYSVFSDFTPAAKFAISGYSSDICDFKKVHNDQDSHNQAIQSQNDKDDVNISATLIDEIVKSENDSSNLSSLNKVQDQDDPSSTIKLGDQGSNAQRAPVDLNVATNNNPNSTDLHKPQTKNDSTPNNFDQNVMLSDNPSNGTDLQGDSNQDENGANATNRSITRNSQEIPNQTSWISKVVVSVEIGTQTDPALTKKKSKRKKSPDKKKTKEKSDAKKKKFSNTKKSNNTCDTKTRKNASETKKNKNTVDATPNNITAVDADEIINASDAEETNTPDSKKRKAVDECEGESKQKKGRNLEDMWNQSFEKLKAFKEEHGHFEVPLGSLRSWVSTQRIQFKKLRDGKQSSMNMRRMQRLTELGVKFVVREKRYFSWEERLEQLKAFKKKNGHLRVPHNDPVLGSFIINTRTFYKKFNELGGKTYNGLTAERINQLHALGFVFQVLTKYNKVGPRRPWEENFAELLQFRTKYGHTRVPYKWPENVPLANFVEWQRKAYKKMKKGEKDCWGMTPERAMKLYEIDFIFDNTKGRGSKVVLEEVNKDYKENESVDVEKQAANANPTSNE